MSRTMTEYEIGLLLGRFVACVAARVLLGFVARGWPASVARVAVLNLFSFFLVSWIAAHGALDGRAVVEIAQLHVYFLPQVAVFMLDVAAHFVRSRRRPKTSQTGPERIEPSF